MDVGIVLNLGPGEQVRRDPASQLEALCIERRWRSWPKIHGVCASLSRSMNHGVTDTTKTGVPRLNGGERQRGGDRSINSIAAGIEHRDAGLRSVFGL